MNSECVKYSMVAVADDGAVIDQKTTETSYGISETQAFFDRHKIGLYSGKIRQILIEREFD